MSKPKSSKLCHALGLVGLHRAIVSLPDSLTDRERPLQDRIVFFEAPTGVHPLTHLEQLLALVWGVDTTDWTDRGYIYNRECACDALQEAIDAGDDVSDDIFLFETGAGGDIGIGPLRVHYARTPKVDLFVTPLRAERLRRALDRIEQLYRDEPARRAAERAAA